MSIFSDKKELFKFYTIEDALPKYMNKIKSKELSFNNINISNSRRKINLPDEENRINKINCNVTRGIYL